MDRIARAVEPHLGYRHELPDGRGEADDRPGDVERRLRPRRGARRRRALLVPTFTGKTASAVARLRPRRPILGLTHHGYALQHMAIEWGVTPVQIAEAPTSRSSGRVARRPRARPGIVEPGDRVVLTAGTAVNIPGSTNVIKVDYRVARAGGRARPRNRVPVAARTFEEEREARRARGVARALLRAGPSSASPSSSASSTSGRSRTTSRRSETLDERRAEVQQLADERRRLRSASLRSATRRGALARRRAGSGSCKPGERLFIVKGIAGWRRAQRTSRGRGRWMTASSSNASSAARRAPSGGSPSAAPTGARRHRAGALRRRGRAVPDDLLPDLPAPRRRGRAARGGRRRRALERRGRARPRAAAEPRARDRRAARGSAASSRRAGRQRRRRLARARHRRQRGTRRGSSACTRTRRSRSRGRATSSASGSWRRSSRSGRQTAAARLDAS